MNKLRIALAFAAALLAAPIPVAAADLDALLASALQDPAIPAMTVLVIRDGKVEGQAVRGVRAVGSPDPARLTDAWHIGSDAKAMTATMIARLVERGVLSWTTPLKTLLPDTPMRPEFQDVTLLELLSHRAGLRDLDDTVDAGLLASAFADTRPLPVQRADFAKLVLNEAPIGPARAESSYSNSGYVLAGAIAERATGKPFETLMRQEVFAPLGMRTSYELAKPGEVLGHLDGKPLTGLKSDNPRLVAPAGEVRLTLADWALFAIDQMAGEQGRGKLLKPATYRLLHTPQGDTSAALGWGVRTWPKGAPTRMLSHSGSNGYWNALIGLLPDLQSGVLVAANSASEGTEAAQVKVLRAVMGELVPAPAPAAPTVP